MKMGGNMTTTKKVSWTWIDSRIKKKIEKLVYVFDTISKGTNVT